MVHQEYQVLRDGTRCQQQGAVSQAGGALGWGGSRRQGLCHTQSKSGTPGHVGR